MFRINIITIIIMNDISTAISINMNYPDIIKEKHNIRDKQQINMFVDRALLLITMVIVTRCLITNSAISLYTHFVRRYVFS